MLDVPSAALARLTPATEARTGPAFPSTQLVMSHKGSVTVELEFTVASGPPEVRVTAQQGDEAFVDAVRRWARQLRVPCLDEIGGRARLRYDFVFDPDAQTRTRVSDPEEERERRLAKCVVWPAATPAYPQRALREGLQGRLIVDARFSAPDQPPEIKFHHRPAAAPFVAAVEPFVRAGRMPCHEGRPATTRVAFIYQLEGEAFGFRPLNLVQWMQSVDGIERQRLAFDTTTMACPFALRLHYFHDAMRHAVVEVGEPHPARQPLIEWLKGTRLNLPKRSLDSVFGAAATIDVPCLKIDLKPQEK